MYQVVFLAVVRPAKGKNKFIAENVNIDFTKCLVNLKISYKNY